MSNFKPPVTSALPFHPIRPAVKAELDKLPEKWIWTDPDGRTVIGWPERDLFETWCRVFDVVEIT